MAVSLLDPKVHRRYPQASPRMTRLVFAGRNAGPSRGRFRGTTEVFLRSGNDWPSIHRPGSARRYPPCRTVRVRWRNTRSPERRRPPLRRPLETAPGGNGSGKLFFDDLTSTGPVAPRKGLKEPLAPCRKSPKSCTIYCLRTKFWKILESSPWHRSVKFAARSR